MRDHSHYRLLLTGLGNVGRSFVGILQSHGTLLRERYGVAFSVVGAADSGGAAVDPAGLDLDALLAAKQSGRSVATLTDVGRAGMSGIDLARSVDAELLLESTPVNLTDGQPGLDTARIALHRGIHVVLANKGPLALAYAELAALSDLSPDKEIRRQGEGETIDSPHLLLFPSPCLRFSACVGGALPSVNIGRRDLIGCRIERVEAVLNGTTHLILRMMENGAEYAAALTEAQQRGIAETDPTLDVEGWDAANKLVILANAVLNQPTTLADLSVTGITNLTVNQLRAALSRNEKIVLLCLAEQTDAATPGAYKLSVRPTALPSDHPLARMSADEMGIVYYTDIAGRASATTLERGPVPTAAAMLRDVLNIVLDVH